MPQLFTYTIRSSLKKFKPLEGYSAQSSNAYSFLAHVKRKFAGKFSQYEIDQAHKKGKITLVIS